MENNKEGIGGGIILGMVALAISVLGFVGWGALFGQYFQKVTQRVTVVTATTTVSVIQEKEDCEKQGGDFYLGGTDVDNGIIIFTRNAPTLKIDCTIHSSKTLFHKEFGNSTTQ